MRRLVLIVAVHRDDPVVSITSATLEALADRTPVPQIGCVMDDIESHRLAQLVEDFCRAIR